MTKKMSQRLPVEKPKTTASKNITVDADLLAMAMSTGSASHFFQSSGRTCQSIKAIIDKRGSRSAESILGEVKGHISVWAQQGNGALLDPAHAS